MHAAKMADRPEDDHLDHGSRRKAASERTCIVTRQASSPDAMLRFVLGPDNQIVPDIKGKLPGRGAWVCAHRSHVSTAASNGAFARAFKTNVPADPQLADLVANRLRAAALQRLALANKAGQVITGAEKVRAALESLEILAILHAGDASADGIRKLEQKFQHVAPDHDIRDQLGSLGGRVFTTAEMSLALGSPNVVHAGIIEGGACRAFLQELIRLIRFEAGNDAFHLENTA